MELICHKKAPMLLLRMMCIGVYWDFLPQCDLLESSSIGGLGPELCAYIDSTISWWTTRGHQDCLSVVQLIAWWRLDEANSRLNLRDACLGESDVLWLRIQLWFACLWSGQQFSRRRWTFLTTWLRKSCILYLLSTLSLHGDRCSLSNHQHSWFPTDVRSWLRGCRRSLWLRCWGLSTWGHQPRWASSVQTRMH